MPWRHALADFERKSVIRQKHHEESQLRTRLELLAAAAPSVLLAAVSAAIRRRAHSIGGIAAATDRRASPRRPRRSQGSQSRFARPPGAVRRVCRRRWQTRPASTALLHCGASRCDEARVGCLRRKSKARDGPASPAFAAIWRAIGARRGSVRSSVWGRRRSDRRTPPAPTLHEETWKCPFHPLPNSTR